MGQLSQSSVAAFLVLSVQLVLVITDDDQLAQKFCENKKHYTAPGFTCCNSKSYPSPGTNPFVDTKILENCLSELDTTESQEKLIRTTWLLYKCMVQKVGAKGVAMEDFSDHMMKRFPTTIQEEIKKSLKAMNDHLKSFPTPSRRKREDEVMYIPVYNYLSVFEYIDSYKNHIPDGDLLRSWDAYYIAEFEACRKLAGETEETIKSFGTERCLSWIQRTTRDGECCNGAPIPMQLMYSPTTDKAVVQNNTATNLMSLAGKYTWTNLSYSSNIDRCHRLSLAVLEGKISTTDFKKEIEDFVAGKIEKPNYQEIAKKLIPSFYPSSLKEDIINTILPEETSTPQDGDFYQNLELDWDMQRYSTFNVSIYQWAVAAEWDNPHENKTRYLMWTCDAYKMISQRIKYFDVTPYCY